MVYHCDGLMRPWRHNNYVWVYISIQNMCNHDVDNSLAGGWMTGSGGRNDDRPFQQETQRYENHRSWNVYCIPTFGLLGGGRGVDPEAFVVWRKVYVFIEGTGEPLLSLLLLLYSDCPLINIIRLRLLRFAGIVHCVWATVIRLGEFVCAQKLETHVPVEG